jgi:hypothetical protein
MGAGGTSSRGAGSSRRARRSVTGLVAVAGLALVLGAVLVVQQPSLLSQALPGLSDCKAVEGDTEVELSTAQAEQASQVAARSMRLELPQRTTTAALVGELDLTEEEADVVAGALKGSNPGALTCLHGGSDESDPDRLNRDGLTPRAATLRAAVVEAFGPQQLGGFAPGGVSEGHSEGSAHYDGRAVDVFFRPVTDANRTRGWSVAHYLVAHAERLAIETVIFDGQIWTARRAVQGWREYDIDTSGRPADVVDILMHRDHVHVDVAD